jgi:hypothetical protein
MFQIEVENCAVIIARLGKKGRERVMWKGKKRNRGTVLRWLTESGVCGSIFSQGDRELEKVSNN